MIPHRPHRDEFETQGAYTAARCLHEQAVSRRAVETLDALLASMADDEITWIDLYDTVLAALNDIDDSGWKS